MKIVVICLLAISTVLAAPEERARRSILASGLLMPAAWAGNAPAGTIALPAIVPGPSGIIKTAGAVAGPAHGLYLG